jgi:mannose/cellobiose epimerase-like protein (N-acyl-D-glucosamine 2-epimerase family)
LGSPSANILEKLMKKFVYIYVYPLVVFSYSLSFSQYVPTSPYLQNPALAIGYVDSCARFWLQTWDSQRGGFYTNIDRGGSVITSWGTNKNTITQSRHAYGLVRAYMLTGDTTYLIAAKRALDWMYLHSWDATYGGWYEQLDINGNPVVPTDDKTAFYQHYALLGIAAYFEATRDTTAWNWLLRGYQDLESHYWDSRPAFHGYYDRTSYNHQSASAKSFNATVDAITTHLLYLYLMTEDTVYKVRLQEMAHEIQQHLVASMPQQAIGFVEVYDSDWNWNNGETMTIMGHVLKTGWCLARINRLFPDTSYVHAAGVLIDHVWQHGYDHALGGPYKDFNRTTGEMLLWGLPDTAKAWWQMEQAIVAGLEMYNLTGQTWYLQMADETINFFMSYFVDHQYGEIFSDRTRYGGFAWNEAKGNSGKAGYHSIETGYYTYLYGNIFYAHQPAVLHYDFASLLFDREIILTPFAVTDSSLRITQVLLDGQSYSNYNPTSRILHLPAGTGGRFEITYAPILTTVASEGITAADRFALFQNYPNPFNPVTTIRFRVGGSEFVTLKVYDVLGREVATLMDGVKVPGTYLVQFEANRLASGVYFYRLVAGNFTSTKKFTLLR